MVAAGVLVATGVAVAAGGGGGTIGGGGGAVGMLTATAMVSTFCTSTSSPKSQPLCPLYSICHQAPSLLLAVTVKLSPGCAVPISGCVVEGPTRILTGLLTTALARATVGVGVTVGVSVLVGVGVIVGALATTNWEPVPV